MLCDVASKEFFLLPLPSFCSTIFRHSVNLAVIDSFSTLRLLVNNNQDFKVENRLKMHKP